MKEESEIYPTVLSDNYERNVCWDKRLFTEMRNQIGLDEDLFFSRVDCCLKRDIE